MLTFVDATDDKAIDVRLTCRSYFRNYEEEEIAARIVHDVEIEGDEALFRYTRDLDGFDANAQSIVVTPEEIEDAYRVVPAEIRRLLLNAASNIENFHRRQLRDDWFIEREDGSYVGMRYVPVDTVGIYIPGGTAGYPSTVLMNLIPAHVAGVRELYVCTPAPDGHVNALTLLAAQTAGADAIFKVGGAQGIAAMAFGTETIPQADVIAGPGNMYVALAQRGVFGYAGVRMIAGPPEVVALADDTADPELIAADFLAQAESDAQCACVLVTPSMPLAQNVDKSLEAQIADLPRKEIAAESLRRYGTAIIGDDLAVCCDVCNYIAPAQLEILTESPQKVLFDIRNAGAIFLGPYSPISLGHYMAGANHVLPTNATARFSSPLGVDTFMRQSSVIHYTKAELARTIDPVAMFARTEDMEAHARSAEVRLKEGENDASEHKGTQNDGD